MNLANEGHEARKKEEEVAAKKRKADEDATWEGQWSIPFLCFVLLLMLNHIPCSYKRTTRGQLAVIQQCGKEEKEGQSRRSGVIRWSHSVSYCEYPPLVNNLTGIHSTGRLA